MFSVHNQHSVNRRLNNGAKYYTSIESRLL
uniref:Uncharacterized protein n=1 Tax=Anguilla anguilla TaxID=7936 RepID=A0A0E9Q9E5_ANGAN